MTAPKIEVRELTVRYDGATALADVTLAVRPNEVTALFGPAGGGKTTLLRALNRLNEVVAGARTEGDVLVDGRSVHAPGTDVSALRRRVGLVCQQSAPFPTSIFENVAYGLRISGLGNRREIADRVEESLRAASIWCEVEGRLPAPALSLSSGQQRRLCIARTLALRPEVLLLDEPAAALDPIATQRIEDLVGALKGTCTIVIAAHTAQQAARVSDAAALLWDGRLVEHGRTAQIFTAPRERLTEDYVTRRVG